MALSSRQIGKGSLRWPRRGPRWLSLDGPIHLLSALAALTMLALLVGLFVRLYRDSSLALQTFGWGFWTSSAWNSPADVAGASGADDSDELDNPDYVPPPRQYGALVSIYGTIISSLIAMLLAVPMSLVIALFLVELAPTWLATVVGGAIELLAAIPSIVFGMWGLVVLVPLLQNYVEPVLQKLTGDQFPLFSGPPIGVGMLGAGLVLALMILPFITAITRDVFRTLPTVLRESAYGMGSTTWEVVWNVTLPYGRRGVIGACFLGLGRALGETMAVTFVIGAGYTISLSLFAPANTISSTLAFKYQEADQEVVRSVLVALGLALLVITVTVQILAQVWLMWLSRSLRRIR
jgi:phosphate transport system permease protein